MKESVLKAFWRDTYQGPSPVPYIISAQVLLFVAIHLFDLIQDLGLINFSLYNYVVRDFTLPLSFLQFLQQPWSLISYPFVYTGLLSLLFDCLWLFWMGNTFLNFLNRRQFLFIFISAVLLGGLSYPIFGTIPAFQNSAQVSYQGVSFALAALVTSIAALVPRSEIRLFLIGNISLKNLAIAYVALSVIFIGMVNKAGAVSFLFAALWGLVVTRALQQGNDFSSFFQLQKRSKLKVVHHGKAFKSTMKYRHQSDLPNQEEIDEILDKISVEGYESLTSQEKEVLFKASDSER
ncbi:rhomboid family intramembrane serine protease [Sphingobacterium griseoflavum]|uniref:Rhomboid family intramembrane serine protease n=1 Tax=Sphingobacterium griseoflavum TaxID=1474952 RepID=A0ABQ3I1P8_9SPHI|nr:rhomboid family intramembrane serine protease [Sphingobacterium griseoflavum]GHE41043.1 rhomboid family intramembrane serine protease [Sphingobacterium griseoflavum]